MASHRATGDYMRPAFGLLLEKLAYGPADMGRVLGVAKKYRIRPPVDIGPAGAWIPPPHAKKMLATAQRHAEAAAPHVINPPAPVSTAQQAMEATMAPFTSPGIAITPGSKPTKYPETYPVEFLFPSSAPLDKANRRALSSIIRGHEVDEIAAVRRRPSLVTTGAGHFSPDVILREHNRVVTLPPGFEGAAEVIRKARSGLEDPLILGRFGMEYGKSPRLSRHARRRMVEALERKGVRLDAADGLAKVRAPASSTAQAIADNEARQAKIQQALRAGTPVPTPEQLVPRPPIKLSAPPIRPPRPLMRPATQYQQGLNQTAVQRLLTPQSMQVQQLLQAWPRLTY